jgi:hypothetical protein
MIEQFTVFTKGGVVLWKKNFSTLKGQPIHELIRKVLLQECILQQISHFQVILGEFAN